MKDWAACSSERAAVDLVRHSNPPIATFYREISPFALSLCTKVLLNNRVIRACLRNPDQ
jgi:hypothetical protein